MERFQEINEHGQCVGPTLPQWSPPPFPPHTELQGSFCTLGPLDPNLHGQALFEAYQSDPTGRLWTYLPYGPFADFAAYRAWLDSMSLLRDPQLYAILDQRTGLPTGVAGFLRIDPANGSIEVGHLAYAPTLQRTPAATEAMYLMMAYAFRLGYRRYEWKCHSMNEPSRSAALRLGFTYEGTFRQAAVVKGRSRDTAWFSIVDGEWSRLRHRFEQWLDPANFDGSGLQRRRLAECG
jgi:RimJ/RimL family protein N-acetyltransferase